MARVGLGSLGVVTEVTLQCVPAHELVEHTYVATSAVLRQQHAKLLRNNKHVRYMWIPYTHDVVVVTNNPLRQVSNSEACCCMFALCLPVSAVTLGLTMSKRMHRIHAWCLRPCRNKVLSCLFCQWHPFLKSSKVYMVAFGVTLMPLLHSVIRATKLACPKS